MKPCFSFLIFFLIGSLFPALGKPLPISDKDLASPPSRIIRTCCSFGSDLRVTAIPVKKVTHITSLDQLGPHQYLGGAQEGNGIIYTRKGGFIDLGHLRDQADWTAYLYSLILRHQEKGGLLQKLGHEGGIKTLLLSLPQPLDSADARLLAARISYDLSVWHEIATWFGASYVPLVTERYSSFSIEDAYSNLLGATLGMKALESELPYEQAMTQLLTQTLQELQAVPTEAGTYQAMETVRNIWWTREKKLPSGKILLERQLDVYSEVKPMLVPGMAEAGQRGAVLQVPEMTRAGAALSNLYELIIRPNYKFPMKTLFPGENRVLITQKDFGTLLDRVAKEWRPQMAQAPAPRPARRP
ncbi:MAG: DUF4056 domain-containing protein [Adhaeribacter sp.]